MANNNFINSAVEYWAELLSADTTKDDKTQFKAELRGLIRTQLNTGITVIELKNSHNTQHILEKALRASYTYLYEDAGIGLVVTLDAENETVTAKRNGKVETLYQKSTKAEPAEGYGYYIKPAVEYWAELLSLDATKDDETKFKAELRGLIKTQLERGITVIELKDDRNEQHILEKALRKSYTSLYEDAGVGLVVTLDIEKGIVTAKRSDREEVLCKRQRAETPPTSLDQSIAEKARQKTGPVLASS